MKPDPHALLDVCQALCTVPPAVAQALGRLERKRVLRENMARLIESADEARKRQLETIHLANATDDATQR